MIVRTRHYFAHALRAVLRTQPHGSTGLAYALRRVAGPEITDRERIELGAAVADLELCGAVAIHTAGRTGSTITAAQEIAR